MHTVVTAIGSPVDERRRVRTCARCTPPPSSTSSCRSAVWRVPTAPVRSKCAQIRCRGSGAGINLANSLAAIDYDPAQAKIGSLLRAIRSAGYTAGTAKIRIPIKYMRCVSLRHPG
jgi:hypothetical protein